MFCEGRLWIHAASKIPDPDTIKAMENFYREIYAVNGITDLQFPEHYPVSRLLGNSNDFSVLEFLFRDVSYSVITNLYLHIDMHRIDIILVCAFHMHLCSICMCVFAYILLFFKNDVSKRKLK